MLNVMTPDEVLQVIREEFSEIEDFYETVALDTAVGRILAEDVTAEEFVPGFNRSTVDGYAVRASDTFGCSDAIPAILPVCGEVKMGEEGAVDFREEACCYVPTGGEVPAGADACVMVEYVEDYGDGTVGILKPAAPGQNMIFRGDDVRPGKTLMEKGRSLTFADIGALAALGKPEVRVKKKMKAAVISTGDELVPCDENPGPGKIRDVNSSLLAAMLKTYGAEAVMFGIVPDDVVLLEKTLEKALADCDMVLISGGSSVGTKDATARVIEKYGSLLVHGIATKPGKPTILGKCGEKPVFGIPGHPVAAYFVSKLYVLPAIARITGRTVRPHSVTAYLSENVASNDGRALYVSARLETVDGRLIAHPVRTKSGLITALAGTDGYFCIGRDCEGLPGGAEVQVYVNEVY